LGARLAPKRFIRTATVLNGWTTHHPKTPPRPAVPNLATVERGWVVVVVVVEVEVEVARMFSGVMVVVVVVVVAAVAEYSRDGRRVGGVVKNGVDGEVLRRVV